MTSFEAITRGKAPQNFNVSAMAPLGLASLQAPKDATSVGRKRAKQ